MEDIVLNITTTPSIIKPKPKPKLIVEQGNKIQNKSKLENSKFLNKKRAPTSNFNKNDQQPTTTEENTSSEPNTYVNKLQHNSHKYNDKRVKSRSQYLNELSQVVLPNIDLIKDENYNPFSAKTFTDLKLSNFLLKQLTKQGYEHLTKVQKQAIPILLEHKNVVIKSETGTGKTLAYVVPLYEHLIRQNENKKINRKDGVYAVIFAPTHELCLQIETTMIKLNSCCIHVVNGTLIGGQKIDTEKSKIRKGINVIICTPGRLLYHLKNTENLSFQNLSHIIFDEADVLLDMGFEKDIKECLRIIAQKNLGGKEYLEIEAFKKYKIFLLSATIDSKIRSMTGFLMKGYKSVGFKSEKEVVDGEPIKDEKTGDNLSNLRQFYSLVYDEFRLIHLISFLYEQKLNKTIIFLNNCDSGDFHKDVLTNIKLNDKLIFPDTEMLRIHGKMKHEERTQVYKKFNTTSKSVFLFATDVIARGLDFPNVDWVVHYDVNPDKKDYENRMGRTARLTNAGNSLIFIMEHEKSILDSCFKSFTLTKLESDSMLIRFIKAINQDLPEDKKMPLNSMDWKGELEVNEQYRKKYSYVIFPMINSIKDYLHSEENRVANARKAFKCSLRAYTTYRKYAAEVFNLNVIHLTRYARAFGLYKESLKYKFDDVEYRVDQRSETNKTKSEKKYHKAQKKAEISEFM